MNIPAVPTTPITSPRFKYRQAVKTDVRRTWRKARLMQHLAKNYKNLQKNVPQETDASIK